MLAVFCKFFSHQRSMRHARRVGAIWQSRCVRCHEPLVRLAKGHWVEKSSAAGSETIEAEERTFDRVWPVSDST